MKTATKPILPGDPLTVLTYDHPHRKTYDLVTMLCAHGYRPRLFALPWVERKGHTPLIPHRPPMRYSVGPGELAKAFGLEIGFGVMKMLPDFGDAVILIGGAGIISTEVLDACPPVINSHPGYLPFSRGLDSVKWSVLFGLAAGVTTHYVTDEVDAGPVIYQDMTDEEHGDTFSTFAQRVYEMEIHALLLSLTADALLDPVEQVGATSYQIRRRMPHRLEVYLEERFRTRLLREVRS